MKAQKIMNPIPYSQHAHKTLRHLIHWNVFFFGILGLIFKKKEKS
jgi:hypothetical protein